MNVVFLLGFLFGGPSCEPWARDSAVITEGIEVDTGTLATATFTFGHALYATEIRGRLDAVPVGGRCYLGSPIDAPREESLHWRLVGACGLACPDGGTERRVPLLPHVDREWLQFGNYSTDPAFDLGGTKSYPALGCRAIPVDKLAPDRWRVAETRADAPAPRRPRTHPRTKEEREAARYWKQHECPYEHLIRLGDRENYHFPPDAQMLARANAELDEARHHWEPGQKTSAACLAKRFTLFSDGDVEGRAIEWAGREAERQVVDVSLALEAADALAALRPLESHEKARLPELWARLPLGIRAAEMCAAMRAPDRVNLWSPTLALAVLIHCPDALRTADGQLPKVTLPRSPTDFTPDATASLRDLLTPMCWATLASMRF